MHDLGAGPSKIVGPLFDFFKMFRNLIQLLFFAVLVAALALETSNTSVISRATQCTASFYPCEKACCWIGHQFCVKGKCENPEYSGGSSGGTTTGSSSSSSSSGGGFPTWAIIAIIGICIFVVALPFCIFG